MLYQMLPKQGCITNTPEFSGLLQQSLTLAPVSVDTAGGCLIWVFLAWWLCSTLQFNWFGSRCRSSVGLLHVCPFWGPGQGIRVWRAEAFLVVMAELSKGTFQTSILLAKARHVTEPKSRDRKSIAPSGRDCRATWGEGVSWRERRIRNSDSIHHIVWNSSVCWQW